MKGYENIKIPQNIDEITLRAIEEGEKYKKKSAIGRKNVAIAASLVLVLLIGFSSTSFARVNFGSVLSALGVKKAEPRLKIRVDNKEVQAIYYGNQNNQTREELEKRLQKAMEGKNLEDIPYAALNKEITIETVNFQTGELSVSEYILSEEGTFRYKEREVKKSVVPVSKGKANLNLGFNTSAVLSSNSSDYLPGNTIRCFVIQADIEGSTFTFAFILRTDVR